MFEELCFRTEGPSALETSRNKSKGFSFSITRTIESHRILTAVLQNVKLHTEYRGTFWTSVRELITRGSHAGRLWCID